MRWPTSDLAVFLDFAAAPNGVKAPTQLYSAALAEIAAACGVRFRFQTSSEGANVVAGLGRLDGPGNELALSQEPFPGMTPASQLVQTFDVDDFASLDANAMYVMFLHELGHSLGRGHESQGVMQPVLDTTLRGLTAFDVVALQDLYGPPVPAGSTLNVPMELRQPPVTGQDGRPYSGSRTLTCTLPDGTRFDLTVSVWNFRKPA